MIPSGRLRGKVQNFFRMPDACAFDQGTNRLIVCDTHRGRLHIQEKDEQYADPQFNLWSHSRVPLLPQNAGPDRIGAGFSMLVDARQLGIR